MTKIDLEQSAHGTQARGYRAKERPVEWSDKADSFQTWKRWECYYVNIGCGRFHRFMFSEKDFTKIVKAMIGALPLSALLEINKLLAKQISLAVGDKNKELKEQTSASAKAREDLSKCRNVVWELRRENLGLKSQLDSQEQ